MTRNKTSWLKLALLAVVCQVAFLTGTMTTHAEETEPSVAASQVLPTSEEAQVTAPEEVTSQEVPADVTPATEAPAPTDKAVLDETIGESQRPGDSPVEIPASAEKGETKQHEAETTPQAPSEPTEAPKASAKAVEEAVPVSDSDTKATKEEAAEPTTEVEPSKKATQEEPTQPAVEENKAVVSEETKAEADKAANESKETEKKVETPKPLVEKKAVPVMVLMSRSARAANVSKKAVLGGRKIDWGENIGVTSSVYNPNFTLDYTVRFEIDGEVGFCLEPGLRAAYGGSYTSTALDNFLKDPNVRKKVSLISYFGFKNNKDQSDEQYIATQFMIWETLGAKLLVKNVRVDYDRRKAEIQRLIDQFDSNASFDNDTHTVKVGETLKVKDTNGFLSRVKDIDKPAGVTAEIHGNELWVKVTKDAPDKAKVKLNQIKIIGTPLAYLHPGKQTIGILHPTEPGQSVLNLKILKQGNIQLFKEDKETGVKAQGAASLEHAVYGLYQADGKKIKEITLKNINGKVQAEIKDLDPGKYVLKEIKAPKGYVRAIRFAISY